MMALLVLIILALYLALSIYLVIRVSEYFKRRFGRGWPAGIVMALVMYNLVFWDAIPIWYTHYRLCHTEAGLKVYQTPEEWAKENPERYKQARAAAGREIIRRSADTSAVRHGWVESTNGFEYEFFWQKERNYAFKTGASGERYIDKATGKVLFETTDFSSAAGKGSLASGANSFGDYKFWTVTGLCERAYPSVSDKFKYRGMTFADYAKIIQGWNKK